ncbi:MAG: hypothetical protein VB084_16030 [Syntrophomonadaceae bacterium]|nr:hypothetical protein [Syntrophomonadaceae bacterium]
MDTSDHNPKKLYDDVASSIVNLHLQQGKLSRDEMYCLLSILDLTVMKKNDYGLIELLKVWKSSVVDPELNDIIKATLLSIDFNNSKSIQRNIETISELLRYNKNLRES